MRYYRYPRQASDEQAWKALYANLDQQEKQQHRRAMILSKIGTGIFWIALVGGIALVVWCASLMQPSHDGALWAILNVVKQILFGIAGGIVAVILAMLFATPLWVCQQKNKKTAKRFLLFKATEHLREAYGLTEPCLVTKCYQCDDNPKFNDHDVCIFVADGELRITTNLLHGFFNPDNDLGCYILSREEMELTLCPHGETTAAKLVGMDVTFLLGQKAYDFIRKHFLNTAEATDLPSPPTHSMSLNPAPFSSIRDGRKTVELRLNDGKRQQIRVGDRIRFTQTDSGEQMTVTVTDIRRYRDFEALYAAEDPLAMGYAAEDVPAPADMNQYYAQENIQRYGALAIEIRKEPNV